MIHKIKSKYILKYIFNYIQDENYPLKIFFYSKYYKNKLDLNLFYCYKKYLDLLGFDLNRYFYRNEKGYFKDILAKEYNNFILKNKLDKEKFENIIYEVINNFNEKDKYYININSPLFEIMSNKRDSNIDFTIYIDILKNDYKFMFNKLNNLNINK